ncbi:hypothetical protein SAMN05660649_05019 [Desulfotomaculum arcticum]|uniref:Uncharacterized protein n=1 Tax=Desulfotruncus arcticus DSM 17038 TaxID=1121424 RepID=A0A1I2ZMA7_9FIRM|nr:hypothetical protein [Desulfotruncus arcticus]SFH38948.1 hypothetical protein SAMN05660649_05019 [Desulfotomaculum arcticum] [Desulfotruncus arcticus DSM 17038]
MFQAAKIDLLYKLIDSMTIIRGYTQLAKEAEHMKWSRNYLDIIMREIDHASSLLKEVETIVDNERQIIKKDKKPLAVSN